MSDDIVTRLRTHTGRCYLKGETPCIRCKAANEIEGLRAQLQIAQDEIERLRSLYDEAYDACRYALANSPRWQENAATVVADYEGEVARRG